jgi:hypothetical protein
MDKKKNISFIDCLFTVIFIYLKICSCPFPLPDNRDLNLPAAAGVPTLACPFRSGGPAFVGRQVCPKVVYFKMVVESTCLGVPSV